MFSVMAVTTTLIEPGDAAKTAENIKGNELLFRIGIVGRLITQLIQIIVVLILFKLFRSVSRKHAVLMVVFALVGIPIAMLSELNNFAALVLLSGADFLSVFETDQLNAMALFFINLHEAGVFIATIFWGLWLFPLGFLIRKSGFFPKIIGVLVMVGGFGYVLDSFSHFILTDYAKYEDILLPIVLLLTFGELLFMGWVLLKGAKLPEKEAS